MEQALKRKKPFHKRFKNEIKAYLLIGIPLLWWGVFFVFALVRTIYFSFSDLTFNVNADLSFTFEHYGRIFGFGSENFDPMFWRALGVSVIWTAVTLVANNFMGLLIAWMLTTLKRKRLRKVLLGLLFWPSLISAVVSAHVIRLVFSGDYSGLFNRVIMLFGGSAQNWLGQESTALIMLMILPILLGFSGRLIIYYAAMLGVPQTYYEAAKLDTSSKVRPFFLITLPLIKNAIVLNLVLSIIEGIRILAPMQLVTMGNYGTNSIVLYIYNLAFNWGDVRAETPQYGRASAYAMIVFVVIMLLSLLQFRLTKKEAANVTAG